VYGVLGLSIFRFYDLDNASAVTISGQDVIRSSAKFINGQYVSLGVASKEQSWLRTYETHMRSDYKNPPLPEDIIQYCLNPKDHCVYIDTDSVYFTATPILKGTTDEEKLQETIAFAYDMEKKLNKFYDAVAKKFFNCSSHRLSIKAEAVSRTALWIRKKRYALNKIYNLEESTPMAKVAPKGLDIVRSSFPEAYKKFMEGVLKDILNLKGKEHIDQQILDFREAMRKMDYIKLARNTSVKDISKHETPTWVRINTFNKGAPAHVKAAIAYNRLLKHLGRETQYQPIRDGDKIKYVYLTPNQYRLDTIAIKTYDDPPEILALVEKHIDYDALFERELEKKLEKFYEALGWGKLPTEVNQLAYEFFNFN
jgi:DNA polymerase elongation subunit (family B)